MNKPDTYKDLAMGWFLSRSSDGTECAVMDGLAAEPDHFFGPAAWDGQAGPSRGKTLAAVKNIKVAEYGRHANPMPMRTALSRQHPVLGPALRSSPQRVSPLALGHCRDSSSTRKTHFFRLSGLAFPTAFRRSYRSAPPMNGSPTFSTKCPNSAHENGVVPGPQLQHDNLTASPQPVGRYIDAAFGASGRTGMTYTVVTQGGPPWVDSNEIASQGITVSVLPAI